MQKLALIEYGGKYFVIKYYNPQMFRERTLVKKIIAGRPFLYTRNDANAEVRRLRGHVVHTMSLSPWR